ncbi:MAG: hypothetical protein PHG96_04705 [Kiritimatiellae bacterium]|jgi:hypothetical protein|nr:hypothetical protein [Kiritimatiellia bacterium]MDD3544644.1 hypothetical protein [Kiritimatiellia bacterium]MDD4623556.1 hypothetical protein [Kiritimatiellia bacterium]
MTFRNLNVTPDEPVSRWGFEGVLAAFERGDLEDWHHVYLAYRDDTTGEVRAFVNEALDVMSHGDIRPELAEVFRLAVAPFDEHLTLSGSMSG